MQEKEQLSEALERLERNIDKEITKLKYDMEPADELIENNDYLEMENAAKEGNQTVDKITDLISQLEGVKWTLEFRLERFDSRIRTKGTCSFPLYRKRRKCPRYKVGYKSYIFAYLLTPATLHAPQ